ncbi:MAG: hypothetical protein M3R24_25915 [Chloroflexota bacterium]|nr:hypothetical protein [Chloroflexota bacterium]
MLRIAVPTKGTRPAGDPVQQPSIGPARRDQAGACRASLRVPGSPASYRPPTTAASRIVVAVRSSWSAPGRLPAPLLEVNN